MSSEIWLISPSRSTFPPSTSLTISLVGRVASSFVEEEEAPFPTLLLAEVSASEEEVKIQNKNNKTIN